MNYFRKGGLSKQSPRGLREPRAMLRGMAPGRAHAGSVEAPFAYEAQEGGCSWTGVQGDGLGGKPGRVTWDLENVCEECGHEAIRGH